ncbi:MAG: DNA cytosine methyltransferase [Armatimonadaceae bacterium]
MSLTFGSLFAGIGGFDLGFERAGLVCKWQVEINEFCRKVLAKHWPDVRRHDDVKTFPPEGSDLDEYRVDVICGGFPCQGISYAGKGEGLQDERSGLWSEYARIVRVLRPRYVVVENSPALRERGLGTVLRDLAGCGFDAEWSLLSACTLGATHMRWRLFIVAHTDGEHGQARIRRAFAHQDGSLQAGHGFEGARHRAKARMEDPSALYRDADGVPDRMERNHAVGNAVVPQVAEWIGRRLMELA